MNLEKLFEGDQNIIFTKWCNGCNAEEAIVSMEAEVNGEWVSLDLGRECLTRLEETDMIE